MKITQDVFSLPPYISTSWKNIASLHLDGDLGKDILVVTLHSGARIEIPSLEAPLLEMIFGAHVSFLEKESSPKGIQSNNQAMFSNPSSVALENPFLLFGGINPLVHDESQANTPLLPGEILSKIGEIARTMGLDNQEEVPEAEQDCNCVKCQIARAIREEMQAHAKKEEIAKEESEEEEVTEADLSFASWQVTKQRENLYLVTNPLEYTEKYLVHLADPIGCTCGKTDCEHIKAVLKT